MKKLLAVILAVWMLLGAANAQMITTGSVNVRSGPGLDYETLGSIAEGEVLVHLYDTEEDERGVEWYRIGYMDMYGWVSSKYAKELPGPAEEVPAKKIAKYKEIAGYFDGDNIGVAAKQIGLKRYCYPYGDGSSIVYYDESLQFGQVDGWFMNVSGPGYVIYGAAVGMKIEDACAKLEEAGMVFDKEREDCVSYHRPTPEGSWMDYAEYDSIIYLNHENGIVYEVKWQGYSG